MQETHPKQKFKRGNCFLFLSDLPCSGNNIFRLCFYYSLGSVFQLSTYKSFYIHARYNFPVISHILLTIIICVSIFSFLCSNLSTIICLFHLVLVFSVLRITASILPLWRIHVPTEKNRRFLTDIKIAATL